MNPRESPDRAGCTRPTPWQERYLDRFYDRGRGWVDGTTEFHDLCASVIRPRGQLLEVGSGPSNKTSRFIAGLGELHGVDPDPSVRANDALSSATVLTSHLLPFRTASFDGCVSSFVVEHVQYPHVHLTEIARVLKPAAPYIFRTPNVRHFVYFVAAHTPQWFHQAVANRLRHLPNDAHDPYPTVYGMNSEAVIRDLARDTGFSVDSIRLIEKNPAYGMASRALFFPFLGYERLVNRSDRLAAFRATILTVLRAS